MRHASRRPVGRAELACLLALQPEHANALAPLLGFVQTAKVPSTSDARSGPAEVGTGRDDVRKPIDGSLPQMPLWQLVSVEHTSDAVLAEQRPSPSEAVLPESTGDLLAVPPTPPIALWSRLEPRLHAWIGERHRSRRLDLTRAVRCLSQRRHMERLPRLTRVRWPTSLCVWLDRRNHMAPVLDDQLDLLKCLYEACGSEAIRLECLTGTEPATMLAARVRPGETVLAVSDAGELTGQPGLWRAAANMVERRGGRALALVPQANAQTAWPSLPWDPKPSRDRATEVDCLLDLVAPAQYVQPGLMRMIRRLDRRLGLDAEVRAWSHADVHRADGVGLLLKPEALARRRPEFAKHADADLQREVADALRAWRAAQPKELIHAETVGWLGDGAPPGDVRAAEAWFAGLDAALVRRGDASGWLSHASRGVLRGIPEARYDDSPLGEALGRIFACAHQGMEGVVLPAGLRMEAVRTALEAPESVSHWAVRQVGGELVLRPNIGTTWPSVIDEPGSPLAVLPARRSVLHLEGERRTSHTLGQQIALPGGDQVFLESDCARLTLSRIMRPEWATACGRDRYGLWAEMAVGEVRHRLRWIPPGRFLMGSPESEAGRDDDEGPQHEVTVTEGFWLGETPVTQALWVAVMEENPSRFQDPARPVEQVSWDDTQTFFNRLEGKFGVAAVLPSEAQWEYACRAGTTTGTWLGDLEILGANNAPLLDDIAWYGGNSGRDFDLDDGYDSSGWPERQYNHARAGTRAVATKAANPWGLYDMLGNVLEWCQDFSRAYHETPEFDPRGPEHGGSRVFRGGAWSDRARYARSAFRFGAHPGARNGALGFRLARGQPAQPAELELPEQAQRAEPTGLRGAEPARSGDVQSPSAQVQARPPAPGAARPEFDNLEPRKPGFFRRLFNKTESP